MPPQQFRTAFSRVEDHDGDGRHDNEDEDTDDDGVLNLSTR